MERITARYQLLFQQLKHLDPDTILGLMAKFRADSFAGKVDLGVGVSAI